MFKKEKAFFLNCGSANYAESSRPKSPDLPKINNRQNGKLAVKVFFGKSSAITTFTKVTRMTKMAKLALLARKGKTVTVATFAKMAKRTKMAKNAKIAKKDKFA